jgi:hypothetical protein
VSAAQNWSRENLAWAAGIFEGEGSIFVHPVKKNSVYLKISMTDEDVLRKFHAIVGLGTICGPYRRLDYKPQWQWACAGGKQVQALLAAFWCFLGDRRKSKAVEAINRISTLQPYRRKAAA